MGETPYIIQGDLQSMVEVLSGGVNGWSVATNQNCCCPEIMKMLHCILGWVRAGCFCQLDWASWTVGGGPLFGLFKHLCS